MAITTALAAANEVLRRVRDPNGTAHADVIYDILTDAQRLVNVAYAGVTTEVSLTLTHRQVLYEYGAVASDVARILSVTCLGRQLVRCNWREFAFGHPAWLHAVGDTPRHWDIIGHNLLAIFPSVTLTGRTATVKYVPSLAAITSVSALEIPAAHVPVMLDIAEQTLLLRSRLFPSLEGAAMSMDRHRDPWLPVIPS